MAAEEETVQCGYCLEQGDYLVDPRTLPCNHICCYPCLVGDFDTNRIVKCGKCKEAFDVTLTRLPSATTRANNSQLCDVCVVKGTRADPAVSYCSTCSRKMCTKHDEMHQEFLPEHKNVMNIKEYKQNQRKLEVRYCIKHKDIPITMGCTTCYDLLCATCIDSSYSCTDGFPHQAVPLDEIVRVFKSKSLEVKVETQAKEEKLSELLKHCTRVLSDYEMKTDEMIQLLHNTRDEQLAEVLSKYDKLEKELSESRRRTRDGILQFMEREIGVRLTEINTVLVLQDVRFRDGHQVDVVSSFAEATDELRRFIDEKLPTFTLADSKKLQAQARCRDIELKMVKDTDIQTSLLDIPTSLLDIQTSLLDIPTSLLDIPTSLLDIPTSLLDIPTSLLDIPTSLLDIPTSLKLKKEVKLPYSCYTVCSHQGVTYVGGNDRTVYRIDETDYSVTNCCTLRGGRNINGLCVYGGRLYSLGFLWRIRVHELNGTLITIWTHADSSTSINKLTVTADRVIVPDKSNKQLTVYSLEGQLIKHIPCPQDGRYGITSICAADAESVVVSSTDTSTVFRVNIGTEEVMWTCTDVTKPGGVTCYGERYILVISKKTTQTKISVLDKETGKRLGKLVGPSTSSSPCIYDLHVTGNTLIVPRSDRLLYYEILDD